MYIRYFLSTAKESTAKKCRQRGAPFEAPPWSLQRATQHKVFCGKYLYLLQKKASQYSYIASPFFLASPKYFLAVNCPFGLVRGGSLSLSFFSKRKWHKEVPSKGCSFRGAPFEIPRTTKGRRPLESNYVMDETACFLGVSVLFLYLSMFSSQKSFVGVLESPPPALFPFRAASPFAGEALTIFDSVASFV